jgi:hypothetical protein
MLLDRGTLTTGEHAGNSHTDWVRWTASSGAVLRSHGAASLCDGRFVVVLGGFRPPPLDVFMFDSQATERRA